MGLPMGDSLTTLSHDELSLLLFALQGGEPAQVPDQSSCEDACPVVDSIEELLCGGEIGPEKQLARHLNNHVREALIDCGMFELMSDSAPPPGAQMNDEQKARLELANQRLSQWSSNVKFNDQEKLLLSKALNRVPRSAWLMMPRTLWRLKRKFRTTNKSAGVK